LFSPLQHLDHVDRSESLVFDVSLTLALLFGLRGTTLALFLAQRGPLVKPRSDFEFAKIFYDSRFHHQRAFL
jgi:hypothetical protein